MILKYSSTVLNNFISLETFIICANINLSKLNIQNCNKLNNICKTKTLLN